MQLEDALRNVNNPQKLAVQLALRWPVVQQRVRVRHEHPVKALQGWLRASCDELIKDGPPLARVLKQQYIEDTPVEHLASDVGLSVSHYHRKRKEMLVALSLRLDAANTAAARVVTIAERQPSPTVGFDAAARRWPRCCLIRTAHRP